MIRLHEVIEVPVSPEEAFRFAADFSNIADWDPGVAASRKVTEGDPGVGTRYELQVSFRGRTLPMTYEVTAWEPHSRAVLVGEGSTVRAEDEIRFEPSGDGTRITYTADLAMKGLLRFAEPFLRGTFDKVGKKAMAGLQAALGA